MPIVNLNKKIAVKKEPRPRREFDQSVLVYRKKIDELFKKGEHHNDKQVLLAVMDMLHKVIPVAEENYQEFPSHTNAAAINHLLNQQREVINDLRSLEDFGKRADMIVRFIGDEYRKILQQTATELFNMQGQNNMGKLTDKDFDTLRKTLAKTLSVSEESSRRRVAQLLQNRE